MASMLYGTLFSSSGWDYYFYGSGDWTSFMYVDEKVICKFKSSLGMRQALNPIAYGILRLSQVRGGIFIPHPRKQC